MMVSLPASGSGSCPLIGKREHTSTARSASMRRIVRCLGQRSTNTPANGPISRAGSAAASATPLTARKHSHPFTRDIRVEMRDRFKRGACRGCGAKKRGEVRKGGNNGESLPLRSLLDSRRMRRESRSEQGRDRSARLGVDKCSTDLLYSATTLLERLA